jgi:hypothetical protein
MVSLLVLLCALGVALPKPRNAPRPMMGKAKPRRAPPPRPRAPAPQTRHEASEALHSALSCEQVELLCSAANRTEAPDDAHAADADVSVLCASLQRECAAAAAAAAEAAARAANETAAAKRAAEAVDAKLASEALSLADAASNVRGTYMARGEPKGEGWCCVRYVHIGKAAGSSFDLWRRYSKSIDPITFHHPLSYFLERHLIQPHCIFGVTLRDPVALFWSQFTFCLGRVCKRKQVFECGFVCCVRGSPLHTAYVKASSTAEGPRNALVAQFMQHPEWWHLGRNPQTRHLGQHVDATQRDGMGGFGYDYTADVVNSSLGGDLGRRYLARAKARLELFDFVLIVEDLEAGYRAQLGWTKGVPHERPQEHAATKWAKAAKLPPQHAPRVRELNQLDVELYDFARELALEYNKRGELSRFAHVATHVLANPKTHDYRDCLKMSRDQHPIVAHANDAVEAKHFRIPMAAAA